ncbi:AAA family ATPase [Sphingobium sp. PNB]|uniref:AAA family ATPase n=1 Tax=Sphingobium sp. PNB TaxID=863934 RepID=UPI001CA4325A|nr:AAA family ATPase [Sphingobium sp. PNB]MCB4862336.1 AAA family ATPase [Sphingobium sp. PNB]
MPRNIETETDFDNDNMPPVWMDEARDAMYAEMGKEPEPPAPLPLIDPSSWAGTTAPERSWKVKDYIPDRQATLLTGKGAAGKSLVSQQQATCIALGIPFLGVETVQTVAIYITCEDDAEELHRRQLAICANLGVSIEDLSGKLFLLSLQGEMGNELATFDHDGRMRVAPRYTQIVKACEDFGIGFVVLDNTAHFYTGNENDRHQVASFINLANRLAITINGAVVVVGHPNKAGDSYSGSTAWENQVRSRLFMEIPLNDDGSCPDPDMRVMRREKSNYAQRGGDLNFMWFKGSFILPADLPEDKRVETADIAQASHENDVFMTCLAVATNQRRNVSHQKGMNYAPKIFAHMTQGKGVSEKGFEAAMERLVTLSKIEFDAPLWQAPNRHWKVGIKAVEAAPTPFAHTPALTPGDLRQPHGQVVDFIAPTPAPTPQKGAAPTPVRQPLRQPASTPGQVIENTAPTLRCADPSPLKGGPGGAAEALPPVEGDWTKNPILNPSAAAPVRLSDEPPAWLDEAPPIDESDVYFDGGDRDA